jgi:hypothetical protein
MSELFSGGKRYFVDSQGHRQEESDRDAAIRQTTATERRLLVDMVCPECSHSWKLDSEGLHIKSCDSGGIYSVYIECPKCRYSESVD